MQLPTYVADGLACHPPHDGLTRVDRFLSSCPGALHINISSASHEYAGLCATNFHTGNDNARTRGCESRTLICPSLHCHHVSARTLASPLPPLIGLSFRDPIPYSTQSGRSKVNFDCMLIPILSPTDQCSLFNKNESMLPT